MKRLSLSCSRRPRGFTLVELLVSVGLTAVLMWGILQLYTTATRFSATMFTEAELVSGGRAVLDRMSHELASTATLDVGYLNIVSDITLDPSTNTLRDTDMIQFVAPVGPDGELAHVCYRLQDPDAQGNLMLCRCIKTPVTDNAVPGENDYAAVSPLGIKVKGLSIQYVDYNSTTGTPESASSTWRDENPNDNIVPRLPRAILLEITLADNKGTISIVLSSGAYLGGSGI